MPESSGSRRDFAKSLDPEDGTEEPGESYFEREIKEKTALRALYCENYDLEGTESLVKLFNRTQCAIRRRVLRQWLFTYIDLFSGENVDLIDDDIRAYSYLAEVKSRNDKDIELLARFFFSICRRMTFDNYCGSSMLAALDYGLNALDAQVFEDKSADLYSLSKALLEKLKTAAMTLSRHVLELHVITIFGLHKVYAWLHEMAPGLTASNIHKEYLERLKGVEDETHYYPYFFYCRLIKLGIKSLPYDHFMAPLITTTRILFYAFCDGGYLSQDRGSIAVLTFNISAIESQYRTLKKARKSKVKHDKWVLKLAKLYKSLKETVEHEEFDFFHGCYCELKAGKFKVGRKRSTKIVHFAMIFVLRYLAIRGPTSSVQTSALNELLRLAELPSADNWVRDLDLFEALLDALYSVHKRGNHGMRAVTMLRRLETVRFPLLQWKFLRWTDQSGSNIWTSAENRTRALKDQLFKNSKQMMGLNFTHEDVRAKYEELRETYQKDDFAKVACVPVDYNEKKHVKEFEYELMYYEMTREERSPYSAPFRDRGYLSRETVFTRTAKKPLRIEDIFHPPFDENEEKEMEDIQRVLLFGLTGVGKTGMMKQYAYLWAMGKLGEEFENVYYVPVHELNARTLNDGGLRTQKTLGSAILNICFSYRRSDTQYAAFRQLVLDDLAKPKTLLILDGFTEADEVGGDLIRSALSLDCKLIVTTRPSTLRHIREHMDLEIECFGMNHEQLARFLSREMPREENEKLIEHLKYNMDLWTIAHVPSNAHILSQMRKSKKRMDEDVFLMNINDLYVDFRRHIWERYMQKPNCAHDVNRGEFFETLEKVAFESLDSQEIDASDDSSFKLTPAIVNDEILMAHANTKSMKEVLRDGGFLYLDMETKKHYFAHQIFQDQFSGHHIARHVILRDYNKSTSTLGTDANQLEAERFFSKNKYSEYRHRMFAFMMYQSGEYKKTEGLVEVFKFIDQFPIDAVGMQHMFLKLQHLESYLIVAGSNAERLAVCQPCLELIDDAAFLPVMWGDNETRTKSSLLKLTKLTNICRNFPKLAAFVLYKWSVLLNEDLPLQNILSIVHKYRAQGTTNALANAVKAGPGTVEKVQECIRSHSDVPSKEVFALEMILVTTATKDHREAPKIVMGLLLRFCESEQPYVRQKAIEGLNVLLTPKIEQPQNIFEAVSKKIEDEDPEVRKAAIACRSHLIRMFPRIFKDEELQNAEESVQHTAINDFVTQVDPFRISEAPPNPNDTLLMGTAKKMIEEYWSSYNPDAAKLVAERLLDKVLTVMKRPRLRIQTVVLHEKSGDTEWTKDGEEVKHFVSLIAETIIKKYPLTAFSFLKPKSE